MLSFTPVANAEAVIVKLLKLSGLNINHQDVIAELDRHPDHPSLLAVSDVLTNFHIENSAYNIGPDDLKLVPCPFIAHTNLNRGDFVLVDKIEGDSAWLSSEKWRRRKFSLRDLKGFFKGVVLTVDAGQKASSGQAPALQKPRFAAGVKKGLIAAGILLALGLSLFFHSAWFSGLNWQTFMLTLVKTAGLLVSVLLLVQSIDSNNPLVQVLCQNHGKSNCNAILSSKAARVPLPEAISLSWSEVGFFYFAWTWLLLLFGGGSITLFRALAVLNIISLPYTFYSIYYQARIAKKWCVLCCTVQALLWLEFIALFTYLPASASSFLKGWNGTVISNVIVTLLVPVLLWAMARPALLKLQQLRPLKGQLRKFKYNAGLFNQMLTAQPKYTQPAEEWSIVLGSPQAANVITMISNPYCPPCAKTHKLLDELLTQRADIQARLIFTANNSEGDIRTPISRHLVALDGLADKEQIIMALNDWYQQKQKNYEAWAKLYPVALNGVENEKIDKQKDWCQMAEVTATPTLLLNGYRLPDLYRLSDLKYML